MAGLTTGTLHGKLGIRAGNTGLINLDDVPVPVENRIGEEGEGFLVAMSAIDQGRYTVAAGAVGLAQACLDACVRYAHERQTFGQEIGEHQLVKQLIAKMAAGTEMGRLLVWRAGWLKNQGLRNTRETSLAKWHATEHAVQAALDAIQVHGANGYSNEFPVERYLRNSKAAVIYEGTSQLHTLIQADYALGYREDRPIRCEPWPAQGWERPALTGTPARPTGREPLARAFGLASGPAARHGIRGRSDGAPSSRRSRRSSPRRSSAGDADCARRASLAARGARAALAGPGSSVAPAAGLVLRLMESRARQPRCSPAADGVHGHVAGGPRALPARLGRTRASRSGGRPSRPSASS